ncbi:MAG TPA: diacylglycerol kinase family protein, partial [Bacteroidales bacterium]|nr:diacylglycerol kinase family protein [Bacteroidales bacterium]
PEKNTGLMKTLVVVNPASGVTNKKGAEAKILAGLDPTRFDARVVFTEGPEHAVQLTRQALEDGVRVVIAVGGDGTINEIGQVLAGTDAILGIIPAGSGNGLARHLKIPMRMNRAIGLINRFKVIRIDTAIVNERVFISTAGMGYDAHVAKKMTKARKRGFLTYFRIISEEYVKYKSRKYVLEIDGRKLERKAFLITLANSSQFGYNTSISPESRLDDGFIDVCVVRKIPFLLLPFYVPRLYSRSFHKTHYIEIIKGKNVNITRKKGKSMHFDGDYYPMGKSLSMTINPSSLNVIIP